MIFPPLAALEEDVDEIELATDELEVAETTAVVDEDVVVAVVLGLLVARKAPATTTIRIITITTAMIVLAIPIFC